MKPEFRLICVLAFGALVVGCENFNLKTRDELKGAEAAPATKPAGAKQVEGAPAGNSQTQAAAASAGDESSHALRWN